MHSEPNFLDNKLNKRFDQNSSFQKEQYQQLVERDEVRGSVGGTMEDSLSHVNANSSLQYAQIEIGDSTVQPLNPANDEEEPGIATINQKVQIQQRLLNQQR